MEENSFEPTKSNNKKIGLIVGIILIIIGVGVFGFFKFYHNDDKENNKGSSTEKTTDEKNMEAYPYYYVVTARYTSTNKDFVDKTFGTNAEERFRNYFQWYNVVHELGHGLIIYNSNVSVVARMQKRDQEPQLEEILVNDFAVAYWKKYGEPEKIQMLKETVDYILSNMKDPTDGKMTFEEYGKQIMTSDTEPTFEEYGWFQFSCVKHSLEKDITLEEAYKNLGLTKEVVFDNEKLSYTITEEKDSDKVINDAVSKFKKWGLNFTEIYHQFDDDPNNNYSAPITKKQYEQLKLQEQ